MAAEAHQNIELKFNPRTIGRLLAQCFGSDDNIWQCVGFQFNRVLDMAANDNTTWHIGESLTFEKDNTNSAYNKKLPLLNVERSLDNSISGKLLQLMKSRALRVKLPVSSISNAIDEFNHFDQGRKKKDKDKHMAMMGGMVMIATIAQMFLGKVILIAGSAFIMAKLALVISVLSSLKKGQSTTGHSGKPEHSTVIVGSHSHESGWHRSMPHNYKPPPEQQHHVALIAASPNIETETEYYTHNNEVSYDEDFRRRRANAFL